MNAYKYQSKSKEYLLEEAHQMDDPEMVEEVNEIFESPAPREVWNQARGRYE